MRSSTTDVAVVGAGIAGLTFAAWLGRSGGIQVTVYEQAGALGEIGAGIQLAPNAVRLLQRLGLADRLRARAVRPEVLRLRGWRDGHVIGRTELGPTCERRYGAPYYAVHRADLHAGLVDAARAAGVRIELGRRCVSVGDGSLGFADGGLATAGLVVGADGIRSAVRTALAVDRPRYSGITVYRGLIDTQAPVAARVSVWIGPGQHCVWYPVSAGRRISFAAAVLDEASGGESGPGESGRGESWQAPGDVAELRRAFAGWHPDVVGLLGRAGPVTRWALYDREPPAQWYRGRVTVIGDAAHPMLPFGAHGANQAIESAVTLAACLGGYGAGPDALAEYQRIRAHRLASVRAVVADNTREHHLADGADQRERDRSMAGRLALERQDWLYAYDASAVSAELGLARAGPFPAELGQLDARGEAELAEDPA